MTTSSSFKTGRPRYIKRTFTDFYVTPSSHVTTYEDSNNNEKTLQRTIENKASYSTQPMYSPMPITLSTTAQQNTSIPSLSQQRSVMTSHNQYERLPIACVTSEFEKVQHPRLTSTDNTRWHYQSDRLRQRSRDTSSVPRGPHDDVVGRITRYNSCDQLSTSERLMTSNRYDSNNCYNKPTSPCQLLVDIVKQSHLLAFPRHRSRDNTPNSHVTLSLRQPPSTTSDYVRIAHNTCHQVPSSTANIQQPPVVMGKEMSRDEVPPTATAGRDSVVTDALDTAIDRLTVCLSESPSELSNSADSDSSTSVHLTSATDKRTRLSKELATIARRRDLCLKKEDSFNRPDSVSPVCHSPQQSAVRRFRCYRRARQHTATSSSSSSTDSELTDDILQQNSRPRLDHDILTRADWSPIESTEKLSWHTADMT